MSKIFLFAFTLLLLFQNSYPSPSSSYHISAFNLPTILSFSLFFLSYFRILPFPQSSHSPSSSYHISVFYPYHRPQSYPTFFPSYYGIPTLLVNFPILKCLSCLPILPFIHPSFFPIMLLLPSYSHFYISILPILFNFKEIFNIQFVIFM